MKKYLEFVTIFSETHAPLPCNADQVALYATWLARTLKYSSIVNYLSGLNYFLKQNGAPPIDYSAFIINTTLKGIRRRLGDAPRQAVPILPGMLRAIFKGLTNSIGHVAWRAAVLCSFRGLLRKCQVTESESMLRRSDFHFHTWGMYCLSAGQKRSSSRKGSFKSQYLDVQTLVYVLSTGQSSTFSKFLLNPSAPPSYCRPQGVASSHLNMTYTSRCLNILGTLPFWMWSAYHRTR